MEFKVGDRVRQSEKSGYLDLDGPMLAEDVGTVVVVKIGHPFPIDVEFERIDRRFVFGEWELEHVDE